MTSATSGAGTVTLPEHLSSPLVFSGVHVTRSLVLCVCFVDHFWLLAIVLSVLLRFKDSDYPFGILKLSTFFIYTEHQKKCNIFIFYIFNI